MLVHEGELTREQISDMIKIDQVGVARHPVPTPSAPSASHPTTLATSASAASTKASVAVSSAYPAMVANPSPRSVGPKAPTGVYGVLPDVQTIDAFLESWFRKVFPNGLEW